MKKLALFAVAGLGLLMFFSCKKDNPGNSSGSSVESVAILGKWQVLRDVDYFYASSNASFLDSVVIPSSSQTYFNFEKGGLLVGYDANSNPPYDSLAYQVVQNKYLVVELQDTLSLKFSANTDTLLVTQLTYNTTDDLSNVSATEADTLELVK
jgi:hypothetical protein